MRSMIIILLYSCSNRIRMMAKASGGYIDELIYTHEKY